MSVCIAIFFCFLDRGNPLTHLTIDLAKSGNDATKFLDSIQPIDTRVLSQTVSMSSLIKSTLVMRGRHLVSQPSSLNLTSDPDCTRVPRL